MRVANRLDLVTLRGAVLSLATAAWLLPLPCAAGPLKVLSAGACERFVGAMAAEFEKRRGQRVLIEEDTVGRLVQRINQGERFDVALLTPARIEKTSGRFAAGSRVELARAALGVGRRQRAPRPATSRVERFRPPLT